MYNFDKLLQRKHTNSTKWDALKRDFGSDDLMPFWVADADFPIFPEIHEAIRKRADEGETFGYTFAGEKYLDSIISWNLERHSLELEKQDIIPAPGVVTALAITLLGTINKDKVLINPPVYSPFFDVVRGLECELVESPLIFKNNRYELDFYDLEEKFITGVKAYIFCSPHNPTGRVWEEWELKQVVKLCEKYHVLLISDEIHYDIVYSAHRHIPILNIDKNAVMITAPSKTFNIAGIKSSVLFVKNPQIREKIQHWIENMHLYLNLFAYDATEIAYKKGGPWVDEMITYLEENAHFVLEYLEKYIPGVKTFMPESTYLMWLDFSEYGLCEKELNRKLQEEAKVALNSGTEYGEGYDQFVRLNIATPRYYLEKGLEEIREVFASGEVFTLKEAGK